MFSVGSFSDWVEDWEWSTWMSRAFLFRVWGEFVSRFMSEPVSDVLVTNGLAFFSFGEGFPPRRNCLQPWFVGTVIGIWPWLVGMRGKETRIPAFTTGGLGLWPGMNEESFRMVRTSHDCSAWWLNGGFYSIV